MVPGAEFDRLRKSNSRNRIRDFDLHDFLVFYYPILLPLVNATVLYAHLNEFEYRIVYYDVNMM